LLNRGHDIGLPLPIHELASLAVVWELAAGGALGEWHQQEAALLDNVNAKQMAGADIDYGRFWVLALPCVCTQRDGDFMYNINKPGSDAVRHVAMYIDTNHSIYPLKLIKLPDSR
jgi:hypothetical protein